MKASLSVVAALALLVAACDQPVSPTAPHVKPVAGAPARATWDPAAGDALAFRGCYAGWEDGWWGGVYCDVRVLQADGTATTLAAEGYDTEKHSWSPDATRIAYVVGGQVAVVAVGDGATTVLGDGHEPAWSPDGARIAFVGYGSGTPEIYLMNASDGGDVVRVTNGVGVSGGPSWTPDGARLVFACEVDAGNADLCSIGTDGSGFARLTSDASADADPDVSPDGAHIAFTRDGQLATADVDGGNVQLLGSSAVQPDWSPTGDRIAFVVAGSGACPADGSYCEFNWIYVANADGSDPTYIGGGQSPAWRPATAVQIPDAPPVARISVSCSALDCSLDGSASTDDRGIASRAWDFGDGTTASGDAYVTHHYAAPGSYTVTLTVTDGAGQASSASAVATAVAPDLPPVARFTASCNGFACSFDGAASSDDHDIVQRAWSFGDGFGAGDVVATTHTYAAGGSYAVRLTVTDGAGQQDDTTLTVTVVDQPPVARFTWTCSNATCTFDGRSSTDDLGVVSYAWSLGTAGTATGAIVKATFRHHSTQDVMLTVRDVAGHSSSVIHTITVK